MPRLIDLMEPTVKSGSGDAEMLCHFSSGYPKGFDMPEDEQSLSKRVPRFLLSFLNPPLENRHLRFELVDLVFEKEDFLVFGVGIHGRKAFEASLRTLPENRAAIMTALMINVTALVMMSKFLSMRPFKPPPKQEKASCRRSMIA